MRVIFEEVQRELFFEIVLNTRDIDHFAQFEGIVGDFVWDIDGIVREINVFIRKEKDNELCHLSKEKKQVPKKDFPKISAERCTKESPKSNPLRSLIARREGVKKKHLQKKK